MRRPEPKQNRYLGSRKPIGDFAIGRGGKIIPNHNKRRNDDRFEKQDSTYFPLQKVPLCPAKWLSMFGREDQTFGGTSSSLSESKKECARGKKRSHLCTGKHVEWGEPELEKERNESIYSPFRKRLLCNFSNF